MNRILTPQQELFLYNYTNPKSETFSNAYKSALKSGYSEEYSQNITGQLPEWLSDSISDLKRLRKAEKNLDEVQDLEIISDEGKVLSDVLRERNKVDLFMAERIGKGKYSVRQEVTGKDGKDLIPDSVSIERAEKALDSYLNDNKGNTTTR